MPGSRNRPLIIYPHDRVLSVPCDEQDMDVKLASFLRWEGTMHAALSGQGYWCGAADPRTGFTLRGQAGCRWSEIAAVHHLLGWAIQDDGPASVLLHPRHGEPGSNILR